MVDGPHNSMVECQPSLPSVTPRQSHEYICAKMAGSAMRPEWQLDLQASGGGRNMAENGGPEHGAPVPFQAMWFLTY